MFLNMKYKEECPEYTESNELFMDVIKNTSGHSIAEKHNFLSTGQVLFYLAFQIHSICDSMILRFIGDYSLAILYRSLIEHSVKHFYIFARFHKEHNDDVGSQYYHDCIYDEQVKKINAVLWPNFFTVKQEHLREHKQLRKNAKQFAFSNMLNYIDALDLADMSEDLAKSIKKLKSDYSLSSSYTHGGPEAISMTRQMPKENIQYTAVSMSILAQLHTVKTFATYESSSKKRLFEVSQRLQHLLETTLKKWPTSPEADI